MNNPEEYSLSVNKYWETYQKFRTNFDAAFAFVVGSILNRCRERFFNDQEKGFKKYLESQISFSVRLAYDFMAISKELSVFKDKKLTMEKLRALLTVAKSGVDINQLYSKVEDLEIKDILSLKTSKKTINPNIAFSLGQISSSVLALEKKVHDFFLCQSKENLTDHQLIIISSAQEKLASILSMIDKNISNTQK